MTQPIKLDFTAPKDKEKAIADFRSLKNHAGWNLVVAIVMANIEILKGQINDGTTDETLESIRRLRDKIQINQNVIDIPNMMLKRLEPIAPSTQNESDPYL